MLTPVMLKPDMQMVLYLYRCRCLTFTRVYGHPLTDAWYLTVQVIVR